jgi:hypothetical protein
MRAVTQIEINPYWKNRGVNSLILEFSCVYNDATNVNLVAHERSNERELVSAHAHERSYERERIRLRIS